jgi:histone-lysine N-methyltransferase SETD1
MFLKLALVDEPMSDLVDPNLWAYKQKEIKALNNGGNFGISHEAATIKGYYIPNITGSARTDGYKKILESEKSKYLPHRIKVAEAREARQRQIAEGRPDPAIAAEAARAAKMKSSAHSRSTRVNNRTHVKDIQTVKQNLATDGQQGDAIRFNQLKKRKKLVKFDRSAIHGWGLYAEENIAMNDMIIEYVGEKVRQAVATIREARYDKQGMGSSYLFRIDEDSIVDATKKGGIARFINHSCAPNCTAKIIRVEGTKRIVIYALKDILKSKFGLFPLF